jgi:dTDP-glucose pyrophosphorylase
MTSAAECLVSDAATLRTAMATLDRGGMQIALVIDVAGRLVGTVTDGDIRRALLSGASLESSLRPHVQSHYTAVTAAVGRAEVLDLMRARSINEVPIVDDDGRVIGLHLLREIIGAVERPNWAVLMAGGEGSRLRPLTERIPKPMIHVAGRPIIERLVLHLLGFGIRRIFLAVHYLGGVIEKHFGDGSQFGCQIEYLREEEARGSGGALALLTERPSHPLVVMNGDLVTQADVGAMLDFHSQGGFLATLAVRPYQHRVPYGCVDVREGRVATIEEKPLICRTINAGIYVLEGRLLDRVPPQGAYPMTALIEDALRHGEPIGAFPLEDDWIDVGHAGQLRDAREGAPS